MTASDHLSGYEPKEKSLFKYLTRKGTTLQAEFFKNSLIRHTHTHTHTHTHGERQRDSGRIWKVKHGLAFCDQLSLRRDLVYETATKIHQARYALFTDRSLCNTRISVIDWTKELALPD